MFGATALVTLLGIRAFVKLRATPLYVLLPLFLAVFIPCSIVGLVPIDLVSSSKHNAKDTLFYLSEEVRLAIWRVVYWLAFFLTWAVLPMLQSYVGSGYYTSPQRLIDAANQNLRYQLVMLVAGLAGLVYVVFSAGLTFSSLKALVIALSHSYALVIALWLMGHGMVNLPRRYWEEADPAKALRTIYRHATLATDTIAEVQSEYASVAAEVLALAVYKEGKYLAWIQDMLEAVEAGPGVPLNGVINSVRVNRSMINEGYLATLNSNFKVASNRLRRHDADWQKMLFEASQLEDIVSAKEGRSLVFRYKRTCLSPKMAFLVYGELRPRLYRALAIICSVLTVVIVWSEITHGTVVSIVNFTVSHTYDLTQQLISTVFLGYMCAAAFSSLSRIRIYKFYALVHRHTDMSSLLFYGMYACRLTVPLSYSYIKMISSRESVFEDFLGQFINLTPLGRYFNDWLPRFILIPMLFTLFNVYDKVREISGVGLTFDEEIDAEEGAESGSPAQQEHAYVSTVEGRELIKKALSDASYRHALRHPHLSSAAESSRASGGSTGSSSSHLGTTAQSSNYEGPSRTSPNHLNQLPVSAHGRGKLQLGGGQIKRTRLQDHAPLVEGVPQDTYEEINRGRGLFARLLGRQQSRDEMKGLLPQYQERRWYQSNNE